jgi:hypothetical protein
MLIIQLLIALCLLTGSSVAQKKPFPHFEDYRVSATFKGKPAPAKIESHRARLYQTRIREGAKEGPNFAGHYTIVTWGCGVACRGVAIVDARTGKVVISPHLIEVTRMPSQDNPSLQFRKDSNLLVIEGWRDTTGKGDTVAGKFYYQWGKNRLKLIRAIMKE